MENNFKTYELTPNREKLQLLRMKKTSLVHKIITTDLRWFQSQNGIFDIDENDFFEFSMMPVNPSIYYVNPNTKGVVESFVMYGAGEIKHLKVIKYNGRLIFIYIPAIPTKSGKNFIICPSLQISEEVYNAEMIALGNLGVVTTDDLSDYKPYFTLKDGFESIPGLPSGLEFTPRNEEEARLIKTLR